MLLAYNTLDQFKRKMMELLPKDWSHSKRKRNSRAKNESAIC
jgi:hypothetical protein